MIQILKEANAIKKKKGGRNNKVSIENQIMMTLEYRLNILLFLKLDIDVLIKHSDFVLSGSNLL